MLLWTEDRNLSLLVIDGPAPMGALRTDGGEQAEANDIPTVGRGATVESLVRASKVEFPPSMWDEISNTPLKHPEELGKSGSMDGRMELDEDLVRRFDNRLKPDHSL